MLKEPLYPPNCRKIDNCSINSLSYNCDIILNETQCKHLSVLNNNIRCLSAHFDEFEAYLSAESIKPSIIALTETWLRDESNLSQFSLKGYHKLIACNRSNGERGGVGLFLDESFKFKVLLKDTLSELLVVETFTPLKTYIMVTYRREMKWSKNAFCEWLTDELNDKLSGKTNIIICGDFNIDLVANKHCYALKDIMLSHNLKLVSPLEVTRHDEDSESYLDHIYSDMKVSKNEVFQSSITDQASEKYIPLKPVLTKKKYWVDNSAKRSINKRNELYKYYKSDSSNPSTREAFEIQRRETKALLRRKKREFIQASFEKASGDIKMFHRHLNDIIGKSKEVIQPSLSEASTIDDFNSYFVNVGMNNQRNIEHVEFKMKQSDNQMQSVFLRPTSTVEIQSIIGKLKNKTSSGPFGISNKLLKFCEPVISPILTILINRCMSYGYFPEQLKVAKIVPIYKEGDRDSFSNYRPISLLSPISKIFERIIYSRIYSYIEKFHLLNDNQFGFRKKRKTVDALACVMEQIKKALNAKHSSCCVFLDVKKAFDTLDHGILLQKLEFLGFRGPVLDLFTSYLTKRSQYTSIRGVTSQLQLMKCGVPQGSVLGPLLFLLYVNDISENVNSSLTLFADDTNIFEDLIPGSHKLKDTLMLVDSWMKGNKLKCNLDKSKAVVFGKKPQELSTDLHGVRIENSVKYLGVIIDEDLNFKDHVRRVQKKLLFCNYTVLRSRQFLTRSQLLVYYRTHVKPIIQYGVLVYACTVFGNLGPIHHLQKRIIRSICFLPKFASVDHFMVTNKIATVYELHVFELVKFILSSIAGRHQSNLLNSVLSFASESSYELRINTGLKAVLPLTKSKAGKLSLSYRVPLLYNKLLSWKVLPPPGDILNSSDVFLNDLSHQIFDCYVMGNEDLIRLVYGLSE